MDTCTKKIVVKDGWGTSKSWICGKPATHVIHGHPRCRHHSKTGRFVARIGDTGEILARFDSEAELRANIHGYPGARMQFVTTSKRRDLV